MGATTLRNGWSVLGFALSLVVPGMYQVQKYSGTSGVALYVGLALLSVALLDTWLLPWMRSRVTESRAARLAAATFVGLAGAFAAVYPIADSGIIGGGSDRDDNIDVATTALLRGRYPYHPRGYLGQPTDGLPGSLFLATPFVLLGKSAYQNLVWLVAFFLMAKWYLREVRLALALLWGMLLLSPAVLHEFVTGGDLIANSVYVPLFTLCVVNLVPDARRRPWAKGLASALLGIGLSSRANFLLIVPLLFSMLVQRGGWRLATRYTALSCATFAGVTLPFYLHDPANFFPLTTLDRLGRLEPVLPCARIVIPCLAGIASVVLSCQRMAHDDLVLLRNFAIVQACLVLSMAVLATIQAGRLELSYTGYGLFFVFPGGLAFWADRCRILCHEGPDGD